MNNKLIISLVTLSGLGWWIIQPPTPPTPEKPMTKDLQQSGLPSSPTPATTLSLQTSPPNIGDSSIDILQHIYHLEKCYQEDNCPFPDTDPKAIYFTVGNTLADDLSLLIQQQQNSDQVMPEATETAQRLMAFENDHVRAKALSFLALQPPSADTLSAIMQGIKDSHDRGVYRQAMMEFSKYPQHTERNNIARFLISQLQHGGKFVGQIISQKSLPLINQDNHTQWTETLQQLPSSSLRYQFLHANLEEYQLLQSGG
jgi:hypothetical protein